MKVKIPRCPFPVGCWVRPDKFDKTLRAFKVRTVTHRNRESYPNNEWLINDRYSGYWLRRVSPPVKARKS